MDYLMNGIIIIFVLACIVFFYNALKFFELRTQKNNKEVVAMKKYVDWDKIEEETVSAKEACECTRSKLQPLIDFVVELFPKKMESFRGEDAEVIPEKKKPLTIDERLALMGNVEKKLKEAIETYSQKEIPYTSDDPDFLSTNRSTVPKKSKPKSAGSTNTPALLRDQLGPSSLCVEEELKKNTKQMESFKGEDAEVIPEKKNPSKDSRLKRYVKKTKRMKKNNRNF